MSNKYDIIFCSIPFTDVDHIYSAPAILKGIVLSHGFRSRTVDFGMELFRLCDYNQEKFNNLQLYFITKGKKLSDSEFIILNTWKEQIVNYFIKNPTKYIGISVLSYYTHKSTMMLLELLRENNIQSKIIIGGLGANVRPWSGILDKFNPVDAFNVFGQALLNMKLVDKIVIGDGEESILKALGDSSDKISILSEMKSYPEPNYEDYDFRHYVTYDDEIYFPITGSKGCVRNCDFCDVAHHFGKFRTRSGKDIATEMLNIQKKYGFNKFQFTDSLVNGGLKPFREFCQVIAEHNEQYPDKKISWRGQYICRQSKDMPQDLYPLMARSGANGLSIGAESGSDNVLKAMNKKTTNNALYHELEQFRKNNIKCNLLTFVGHWAETASDFKDHCRMLIKALPYVRSGIIGVVEFGGLAAILDGTPSMELVHSKKMITSESNRELLWFNPENPMGIRERIFRRLFLYKLQERLKFPTYNDISRILEIHELLLNDKEHINSFYSAYSDKIPNSVTEVMFDDFNLALSELCREEKLEIVLDIEVDDYNGSPVFSVSFNGNTVYENDKLSKGRHLIKINDECVNSGSNSIELTMSGKGDEDTLVENGSIIRDKFVKFNDIIINNYSMFDDIEFFMQHLKSTDGLEAHMGLWRNQTLVFNYQDSFNLWYNSETSKNSNSYKSVLSTKETNDIVNTLADFARTLT